MDKVKFYVGLDVHKDSIAIASAAAYSRDDPHFVGTTRYSVISLTKALSRLGAPSELSICHEAGPCGYGLVQHLLNSFNKYPRQLSGCKYGSRSVTTSCAISSSVPVPGRGSQRPVWLRKAAP